MKKIFLKSGLTQDTANPIDKLPELTQIIADVMYANGFPIITGCCNTTTLTNGASLTWDSTTNKWVAAGAVGGGSSNLGYTPSPTDGLVSNSNGTGFIIPLGTAVNAGLLSPTNFTKLLNTSGINSSDVTVTDSNSIDFTLTGQDLTGVIKGIGTALASSILSTDGSGNILYVTLASKEKIDYLVPTAINTVPNLTAIPSDPTKVKFYIDGLLTRGITSSATGAVTVNPAIIGHNIELDCEVTAIYFV